MKNSIFLPPEWGEQSGVQITWPHRDTDWGYMLDEVSACFMAIAHEIAKRENLLIITPEVEDVRMLFGSMDGYRNVSVCEMKTNDTWSRDHAGISVIKDGEPVINNFVFNGWGMKFAANYDNMITQNMFDKKLFDSKVRLQSGLGFVLEGGSIETDGNGTLLTTSQCLLSPNRNGHLSKEDIEQKLKDFLGIRKVLWLNHGHVAGDDTDGHIDTLARFCNKNTIAYIKCEDSGDEHYSDLLEMEKELSAMTNADGEHYTLVPLPMPKPVMWKGERLPATYANFLIINNAVLVPLYGSVEDTEAMQVFRTLFPDREVTGINCMALIKQHGSLHCVTMQYPKGFIL